MHRILASVAALALMAAPGTAAAQEFSISAGVAFTTDYVFRGETQSDNRPAIQPYVELESRGFYVGIWGSNVRGFGEDLEVDLYAGFRNSIGAFSYDIGYARYFYDNSGNCCGEFTLSLGVDTEVGMSLGADVGYDHTGKIWAASVNASYAFNDTVSVSAEAGRVQSSRNFWNVGVGVGLNDFTSLDFRVHDTSIGSPRFVATASFDFSLR